MSDPVANALISATTTLAARNGVLERENARVRAENEGLVELAQQAGPLGTSLKEACEAAIAADRDLDQIERTHGIVRPSRLPPSADVAALWRALPDPY
jgi:hypothetical protein